MKVTVATVCYNSQDTIEKTIRSVLDQTYSDIEYIIVDGASTDDTLSIVKRYQRISDIVVVSEPDNGLYDAMNKAASLATGDYIIYMNSGDEFADPSVVSQISSSLNDTNDIVYGDVIRIKEHGKVLEKYGSWNTPFFLLLQGRMMCHQSIFVKCSIMREYGFNTDYSITADYDFIMRSVHDRRRFCYKDVTVSIVDCIDGISSDMDNLDLMRRQDDQSMKENFRIIYYLMYFPKAVVRTMKRFCGRKSV